MEVFMGNIQKEITLDDVRKMTDEQRAKITPEQKARLLEERARNERIESIDFINNQTFKEFLDNEGYEIVGYDHNHYNFERNYIYFSPFDGYERAYRSTDRGLILIGPQDKWEEYHVDDFMCSHTAGNPFVKYIDWGLTEFKVYNIVNNSDAGGWGNDEPSYAARLEKDLSKEWVKFWAMKDQDYAKYILNKCAKVRAEAPKDIENYNNMLAKRIAELEKENTQRIDGVNKKVEKYDQIEQIVKSVKSDLQV